MSKRLYIVGVAGLCLTLGYAALLAANPAFADSGSITDLTPSASPSASPTATPAALPVTGSSSYVLLSLAGIFIISGALYAVLPRHKA